MNELNNLRIALTTANAELAETRKMLAEARHTVYVMLKRDLERLKDEEDFRDDLFNRICVLGETLTAGKSKKDLK